jgi:beta-N-acetylhexosaminidase
MVKTALNAARLPSFVARPIRLKRLALCLSLVLGASACGSASAVHLVTAARSAPTAGSLGATSGGTPAAPSRGHNGAVGPTASSPNPGTVLSADRAIGQMLMSHVTGLRASPRLLARIRRGQVGSVILYRENISSDEQLSALTGSLQQAARAGGNPPLFIGTDQEGGSVKRLYNVPPTMSAREMGATAHRRSVAESQGRATGLKLRHLGINLDFAPVADIPTTTNNFLRDRAFGYDLRSVEEGATGFAIGLAHARVAASAKHFPGLGAAGPLDSDFTVVAIRASKAQLRASYAPYRSIARAGPTVGPMVMISDALYPNLDGSNVPAVLSKQILHTELAAAQLGGRVTITDDLEVPSVLRYGDAAVTAVRAGDDILMFAQHEASSEHAYEAIRAAIANGTIPKSLVLEAAARVIVLKETLNVGQR